MDEHISFDELQTFAFAEKLTPAIIQLGAKINSHILSCDECADQYNILIELREQSEKMIQQDAKKLEQSTDSLEAQRSQIEDIMSGSEDRESSHGREEPSQRKGLSRT